MLASSAFVPSDKPFLSVGLVWEGVRMRMWSSCIAHFFPCPFLLPRLHLCLLSTSILFCPYSGRHVAVAWFCYPSTRKAPITWRLTTANLSRRHFRSGLRFPWQVYWRCLFVSYISSPFLIFLRATLAWTKWLVLVVASGRPFDKHSGVSK